MPLFPEAVKSLEIPFKDSASCILSSLKKANENNTLNFGPDYKVMSSAGDFIDIKTFYISTITGDRDFYILALKDNDFVGYIMSSIEFFKNCCVARGDINVGMKKKGIATVIGIVNVDILQRESVRRNCSNWKLLIKMEKF